MKPDGAVSTFRRTAASREILRVVLAASAALLFVSCGREPADAPAGLPKRIRLATTTSTENSGILYDLLDPFEKKFGVAVDVLAVGTGKALKLGEMGEVDAVLVHSRNAEEAFVSRGFGVNRREFMYNDFVLLGPEDDPAGIRGSGRAHAALRAIADKGAPFASRGDHSGTHDKEIALWKKAGVTPSGPWLIETGQGMGATLMLADQKRAYCLADRGTFIAFRRRIDLAVLLEGDDALDNPYSIIAVNPSRFPGIGYSGAMLLVAWLTSPEAAEIIAGFRKDGEVLFHPLLRREAAGGRR